MGIDDKPLEIPLLPQSKKTSQSKRRWSSKTRVTTPKDSSPDQTTESLSLMRFLSAEVSPSDKIGSEYWAQHTHFLAERRSVVRVCKDTVRTLLIENLHKVGGNLRQLIVLDNAKIDATNVQGFLSNRRRSEINALLLYVSFLGSADLLPHFQRAGADINYAEPQQGLTALHLCAFVDCIEGVRYLVDNGAEINPRTVNTPFQYAAFGNAENVANYFISKRISQVNYLGDDSVLHAAARFNAVNIVKLVAKNNRALDQLDWTGHAPVHYAAVQGYTDCLAELLKAGCDVDRTTLDGCTALQLAAADGSTMTLEILLDNGADATKKIQGGYNALHLTAKSLFVGTAEVLLRKAKTDPDVANDDGWTSFHFALANDQSAVDFCKLLIAWNADLNKSDNDGYAPLHTAVSWHQYRCVEILIREGADLTAKTKLGTSALAVIRRSSPTSLNAFKQRLDASIEIRESDTANGDVRMTIDFSALLQPHQKRDTSTVSAFVNNGYKSILEHPVCHAFLHIKWNMMRKFFLARLVFHLIYVIIISTWAIMGLAHDCYNEAHGIFANDTRALCDSAFEFNEFILENPGFLDVLRYVVMTVCGMELVRIWFKCFLTRRLDNFPEMISETVSTLGALATCFLINGCTKLWQNHLGAWVVLLGWLKMMLIIGQLPSFGAYVAMYMKIQAQVFKLFLAYGCVFVGFAVSFTVIFSHSQSFTNPVTAVVKVLVMTTGEFEFGDLFFPENEDDIPPSIYAQASTHFIFLLFVLTTSIIIMNLLIGIAVNDIEGLEKTAGVIKLMYQTKLISTLDNSIFIDYLSNDNVKSRFRSNRMPKEITVCPFSRTEKRLPPEVLAMAYRVGQNCDTSQDFGVVSFKRTSGISYARLKTNYSRIRSESRRHDSQHSPGDDMERLQLHVNRLESRIQDLISALTISDQSTVTFDQEDDHERLCE